MSTVRRVARNTGIIIVGDIVFRLISLVVTIYLARYLGTAGFGKYNFVFAYLAFFNILTDLGLQTILVREMSRNPSITPKLIGNAYIIRLILTAIAFISSIVVISLMSYPADTTTYIYIASLTLLFVSFSDFYRTIFEANLRMEYNIIAKLIFKGLSAFLIFLIILTKGTLLHIISALVLSEMVKMIFNYIFSRKFVKPHFEFDLKLWKYLFKEALPIAIYSVVWIIHFRTDVVMLSMMQGDASVGIYSAAYKLGEPITLVTSALSISLFPLMSQFFKNSKEKLIKICEFSIRYILITMLPITISVTFLADRIIFLIYGSEFKYSASVLQILIWAFILTSINSVLLNLLISINQQKLNTISITLCAITNVILNFFLISILSYNGAALATVVTKAILFLASFFFISRRLEIIPLHKIFLRPFIGGIIMSIFIYYFSELNIFILIISAAIIYLMMLLILKEFSMKDIDMVKKVFNIK